MRIGLLGTGPWARLTHGPALVEHPETELVGVWGRRPQAAAELAGHLGTRAYDSADDLFADCEAVAFALPPDVQAPLAATLEQGIADIKREQGLPLDFPPAVEALAAQVATAPRLPELDRTDVPLVTIDPVGSMDLDQALHVERNGGGFRVYYAIADVAAFVTAGDAIDVEALATSLRPELVQLWYQMALNGRRDLGYAPSPRSGFEMSLLRMLAFRPGEQAQAAASVPPTAARASTSVPAAAAAAAQMRAAWANTFLAEDFLDDDGLHLVDALGVRQRRGSGHDGLDLRDARAPQQQQHSRQKGEVRRVSAMSAGASLPQGRPSPSSLSLPFLLLPRGGGPALPTLNAWMPR